MLRSYVQGLSCLHCTWPTPIRILGQVIVLQGLPGVILENRTRNKPKQCSTKHTGKYIPKLQVKMVFISYINMYIIIVSINNSVHRYKIIECFKTSKFSMQYKL